MKANSWIGLAVVLAGSLAGEARGDLMLGNLAGADGSGATSVELTFAIEFHTGPSNETLGSATFLIRQSANATVYGGLHAFNPADPSTPGALIDSFATPFLTDGDPVAATFTPSRPVTLLANTTYWFQLQASAGDFGYAFGSTPVGTGATYLGDYFDSSFFTGSSGIPAFELDTLTIPEPGSMTLMAIAAGIGIVVKRRSGVDAADRA